MNRTINFSTYLTPYGYTVNATVTKHGIDLSAEYANNEKIVELDELNAMTAENARAIALLLQAAADELEKATDS